jgi:hypothetical protein
MNSVNQNTLLRIILLSMIAASSAIVLAIQFTYALSVNEDCGPAHVNITSSSHDIGMPVGNFTAPIDQGMPVGNFTAPIDQGMPVGNFTAPIDQGMPVGNFTAPIDQGMPVGNFTAPIDHSLLVNIMPTANSATIVNITSMGKESTCIILATLTPQ